MRRVLAGVAAVLAAVCGAVGPARAVGGGPEADLAYHGAASLADGRVEVRFTPGNFGPSVHTVSICSSTSDGAPRSRTRSPIRSPTSSAASAPTRHSTARDSDRAHPAGSVCAPAERLAASARPGHGRRLLLLSLG